MKKNYLCFFAFSIVFTAAGILHGQNTYVTGAAKVKVESNTLFYHGGSFNVVNEAAGTANTIINEGNIQIVGGYTNTATTANASVAEFDKGNNFVNVWNGVDSYGQVIIEDGATSTGYLTMQKNPIDTDAFDLGQFAIPFQYGTYNSEDAFKFLFGSAIPYVGDCGVNVNCGTTRYAQSLLSWDNVEYESDAEPTGESVNSTKYYYLNFTSNGTGLKNIMDSHSSSNTPLSYKGIPTPNSVTLAMSIANHPYTATSQWNASGCSGEGGENCWSRKRNNYNERLESYIDDAFVNIADVGANQTTYGKYGFQYGNPFTSNLDLSGLTLPNLRGVYKYSDVTTTEENGGQGTTAVESQFVKATRTGAGQWTGSAEALIVKPFEGFGLHLNDDTGGSLTIGDAEKTFAMTPSGSVSPRLVNDFHQLGLYLVKNDELGTPTGNHLFIVAMAEGVTGEKQEYESDYSGSINEDTGFFTTTTGFYGLQESADEIVTDFTPLYINAINSNDYVAKPINIVFNRNTEGSFKLKGDLYEGNIFNKLTEGGFQNDNKFYFHDTVEDVLMEIDSNFEYLIGNDVESSFDRFVVYWNGYPEEDDTMGTADLISSRTIVFKHGSEYKVRFNDQWNSANLTVYDISGRVIYTANSINTTHDHVLGIKQPGVYVVKSQSEKGETELQKIIVKF